MTLPITKEEMANIAGMSREAMSRKLKVFSDLGIIKLQGCCYTKPIKNKQGAYEHDTNYENINKSEVVEVKNLVEYQDGQIVSKTLVQNSAVSITLFAFEKDEEISTHASGGDAFVTVLDGQGKFTIGGEEFIVKAGESIVMPANVPHAVFGIERFKMQLVVVF